MVKISSWGIIDLRIWIRIYCVVWRLCGGSVQFRERMEEGAEKDQTHLVHRPHGETEKEEVEVEDVMIRSKVLHTHKNNINNKKYGKHIKKTHVRECTQKTRASEFKIANFQDDKRRLLLSHSVQIDPALIHLLGGLVDRCATQTLTLAVQNGNVIGGQARFRLDGHQQRRAATRRHALAGEMLGLEGQREGSFLAGRREQIVCMNNVFGVPLDRRIMLSASFA